MPQSVAYTNNIASIVITSRQVKLFIYITRYVIDYTSIHLFNQIHTQTHI